MDFLEKQIEAKIVDAVESAVGADYSVTGFLQPSVQGVEKTSGLTGILITCRPRVGVMGRGEVTFSVLFDVRLEVARDATGDMLADMVAPLMNLVEGWHQDVSTLRTSVNVDGVFRADGVVNADGGDAGFDIESLVWYWNFSLSLKGWMI